MLIGASVRPETVTTARNKIAKELQQMSQVLDVTPNVLDLGLGLLPGSALSVQRPPAGGQETGLDHPQRQEGEGPSGCLP